MSKSDKLTELENRIAQLEQARSPSERIKAACTRREFVYGGIVGAAGMAAMTGTAAAQTFPEDFHGMALLIGDDADKPDPSGSFFDNKTEYHYVYFATDTGKIYTLETEDSSWQLFGSGAVGGGGGGDVEYQEDGSSLTTAVAVINAATGITATEPTADEIDIDLDESVLKDGGAKELDVADLAGGLGTSGQIPETDGAAVSWTDKVLSDSGSDTGDGGDIYQLPQTEDAIDLQGGGELQNVESLDTEKLYNADNPTTVRVFKDGTTIRAHGRTGEIDSGSDAATVIQSAINALPDTGGRVEIAAGEYTISSSLSWEHPKQSVEIVGEVRGRGATSNLSGEASNGTKLKADAAHPIFDINDTGTASSDKITFELEKLYLVGTGDANATPAIRCEWIDQSIFRQLFISFYQTGMEMGVDGGNCNAYNVHECIFIDVGKGIRHHIGAKPQFYDSKFLNSTGAGIHYSDHTRGIIAGCDFHKNGGPGVHLQNVSRCAIVGNIFDRNDVAGIKLASASGNASTSGRNLVAGNVIENGTNGADGVLLDSASGRNAVVGNFITENSGAGITTTSSDNDVLIASNYIHNNTLHGIEANGGGTQVLGNHVTSNGGSGGDHDGILLAGNNCLASGNYMFGNDRDAIRVTANDCWLPWNKNPDSGITTGTRTILNGLGYNAGDPSSTGDWNGNGVEGVTVRDTTNANTYKFNNGTWSQIASA